MKNDEYGMIMNSALSNFLTDMVSEEKRDRRQQLQEENAALRSVRRP